MELGLEPAFDRFADGARDDDATGRGLGFEARRHVHAIAVEILAIDDQVAEVQANAEHDGGIHGLVSVGLGHGLLELDGCAERIHGAGELDQSAVALISLPARPPWRASSWLKALGAMFPQARDRGTLVPSHQAGIADLGGEDCC